MLCAIAMAVLRPEGNQLARERNVFIPVCVLRQPFDYQAQGQGQSALPLCSTRTW